MNAKDQFHFGIVVDDIDSMLETLSDRFGYEWCDEMGGPTPVTRPSGGLDAGWGRPRSSGGGVADRTRSMGRS